MIRPHHPTFIGLSAALALAPAAWGSVLFSTSNSNPNTTLVDVTTATVIEQGVTLTASAAGGNLNILATSAELFGIAGNGAGTISDASEILSLSFDADVFLEQIDLNQLGNGESATLAIPSLNLNFTVADNGTNLVVTALGGSAALTGITVGPTTGTTADTINFAAGSFALTAGSVVDISVLDTFVSPAGDSSVALEGITVTIPEPASLALVGIGGLVLLGRRGKEI